MVMTKRLLIAAFLVALLLVAAADAYKSVKELKPQTEQDAHEHHMLHARHRKRELPRDKTHHEEMVAKLNHPERVLSRAYHHKVGPEYPDVHPEIHRHSYKVPARFDSNGDHIPDEIHDEQIHSLHQR
jgi:Ni/Co efflux regulator RcnB